MSATPVKRRILKCLAVLAALGAAGAVSLVTALWVEHRFELTLPAPTGPFVVGRAIYDWTDGTASDPLAPAPGTKRELLVWMWYPAAGAGSSTKADEYLPASVRPPAGRGLGPSLFALLTRDYSKVHGHSFRDASPAPQPAAFPVVIMRAGASAPVVNYSTLAEDLASHGYVVVGFDAPYRTIQVAFPDGRVIVRRPENNPELFDGRDLDILADKLLAAWCADTAFVLGRLAQWNASDPSGRFAGRLDMTRVGVFGHSFGGATAAQFCSEDSRCMAGIDIDGALFGKVIETGIQKPFLFLLSGRGDFSSDAEVRKIEADIQSVYDRLPPDRRLRAVIDGGNHFTFSDDGALLKSGLVRRALRAFGVLGIDGRRQLAIAAYCVRGFFDAYLKDDGAPRPELASPLYPELRVIQ